MRLRPFFKYFGSKFNLASRYPRPEGGTIVEPFAGSASYSTLHFDRSVVLVERTPWVADIWGWLIRAAPEEILALPTDLEPGTDLDSLGLGYDAASLIAAWQRVGRNDNRTVSVWNGKPGMWRPKARDDIAKQVDRIRHWQAIKGDGLAYMESRLDDPDVT